MPSRKVEVSNLRRNIHVIEVLEASVRRVLTDSGVSWKTKKRKKDFGRRRGREKDQKEGERPWIVYQGSLADLT